MGWCGHKDNLITVQQILKDSFGIERPFYKRPTAYYLTIYKKADLQKLAEILLQSYGPSLIRKRKLLERLSEIKRTKR